VDWHAQLVGDQVLTALVPVEVCEPGLIRDARHRAVRELSLAQCGERFHERVIKWKGAVSVA
jgi:hypothetical protein